MADVTICLINMFLFMLSIVLFYWCVAACLVRPLFLSLCHTPAGHGEGLLPGNVEADGQVRRGFPGVPVSDLAAHVRADLATKVSRGSCVRII